jgi:hypothetical protein
MGQPALAVTLAVAVLVTLWPAHWLFDLAFAERVKESRLLQLVTDRVSLAEEASEAVAGAGAIVERVDLRQLGEHVLVDLTVVCNSKVAEEVVARLKAMEGVAVVTDHAFEHEARR